MYLLMPYILIVLSILTTVSLQHNYKLPNIVFNIHDIQNFHYYKQFYHSHPFDQIVNQVPFNHKIIYTHKQCNGTCLHNDECLTFSSLLNQSYCFTSRYHSGERMLVQQIRSYLIYQNLGHTLWWKYMDLFSNNRCYIKIQITKCARETLKQLGVQAGSIRQLQEKVFSFITPQKLQNLQINGAIIRVNLTGEQKVSNIYTSQLKQTIVDICRIHRKGQLEQLCKHVLGQPLIINITSLDYYEHTFFEPNLHKNMSVTRQVHIYFAQHLKLSNTFIIYSVGKAQNYQLFLRNNSLNSTGDFFQAFSASQFNTTTAYNRTTAYNKTNLKALSSVQTTSGYEHYIKIQQKQLKNREVKLNVSFNGHKISYLRVVQQAGNILRTGETKRSIMEYTLSYDVIFDDIQQNQLEYYQLKIQLSTKIYKDSPKIVLRGEKRNWNVLYLCKNITENSTIVIFVNKTIFLESASKQCITLADGDGQIDCSLKLQLSFNTSNNGNNYYMKNHSIVLSLRKSISTQITHYHQYKNNFTFNDQLVQKFQLANFGPTFKLLPAKVQLRLFDSPLDFQVRRCKDYIPCDFKSIADWQRHHQQFTTPQPFSKYYNTYQGSWITIQFNSIRNQLPQHTKIQNISLFLIYKRKENDKQKITDIKERMFFSYYYGRIVTSLSSSYTMLPDQQSKRFVLRQPYNFVSRFYCFALAVDSGNKNTRVYTRAFMKNYNYEYLFQKIDKKQIGLQQSNYQKLCFAYNNSFDLIIDVYVQMNKQDNSQIFTSNYQIGYTVDEIREIMPLRPLYLLSKSSKEVIVQSESYNQNPSSYFTILLAANEVVIIDFQAIIKEKEILLCFFEKKGIFFKIQYCLAETAIKYWGLTSKGCKGAKYANGNQVKILFIKVFQNDENASSFEIKLKVQRALDKLQPRQIKKEYYQELNKISNQMQIEKENIEEKYYAFKKEKIREDENIQEKIDNQSKIQKASENMSQLIKNQSISKEEVNKNQSISKDKEETKKNQSISKEEVNKNQSISKDKEETKKNQSISKEEVNKNQSISKDKEETKKNQSISKEEVNKNQSISKDKEETKKNQSISKEEVNKNQSISKDKEETKKNQSISKDLTSSSTPQDFFQSYFLTFLLIFLTILLILLFVLFLMMRRIINLLTQKYIKSSNSLFVSQISSNSSHLSQKQGIVS